MDLAQSRVTIESGLPIPRRMGDCRPHTAASAALRALMVGESMIYPAKPGEPVSQTGHRAGGMFGHLKPKRFSRRVVFENGAPFLRVWRVK